MKLRNLISSRRLVVAGFGMTDVEVMRVIRRVGRLANPEQPIFALMPDIDGFRHSHERVEMLERYNVDVVPYRNPDGDHRRLLELVQTYGSFVIRRSLSFGRPERPCPSYDPETSGLLVYNELALRPGARSSDDVLGSLLKISTLVFIATNPRSTSTSIHQGVASQVDLGSDSQERTDTAIADLISDGLVSSQPGSPDSYDLTDEGRDLLDGKRASAELKREKFTASLAARCAATRLSSDQKGRITRVAESFLKNCVERRSLGVAMAGQASQRDQQQFHIVALLQSLPEFMEELEDEDEAKELVAMVIDVLGRPNEVESKYIGLLLQAHFAVHLLGRDKDAVNARLAEFARTLFLIDSSVLIHLLARSSSPNLAATEMCTRLRDASAGVVTTDRFCEEIAEHVRWAIRKVDGRTGRVTVRTLEAATGRAGQWPNGFLEGFLNESTGPAGPTTIHQYLESAIGDPHAGGGYRADEISTALESKGIPAVSFGHWDGFTDELFFERDQEQGRIAELRERRSNYKHERQVKAEAEALLLVQEIRNGRATIGGVHPENAVFLSHTRLLDRLSTTGPPITMHPGDTLQWLATLRPPADDELSYLTSGLLWELDQRGLTVVDASQLGLLFGPLIAASRSQLPDEVLKHRQLIGARFGQPAESAFSEQRELDLPVILLSYEAQRADALEKRLSDEDALRKRQRQTELNQKDRAELELLRAQKIERKRKAQKQRRRAASNPSKRKQRRK